MSFIPLHVQSGFAYLQSGLISESIPPIAKKLGFKGIGLADSNTLSGYAPFATSAKKIGIEAYFGIQVIIEGYHFALYIENEEGYRSLLSFKEKLNKGPLIFSDLLKTQGLSLVFIIKEKTSLSFFSSPHLKEIRDAFSHFFVGLEYLEKDEGVIDEARRLSKKEDLPLLAFPYIRYQRAKDAIVIEIEEAIREHKTLKEKALEGNEYFIEEEKLSAFYQKEEIDNTELFSKNLRFDYFKKRGKLLRYTDSYENSKKLLNELSLNGLKKKKKTSDEYLKRLSSELEIINKMGYADYFLLVQDYVNYAKEHGILVGPGRGSGGGSLVAYALGIVSPDPLKEGLLFERFLNPERSSMPDIDCDFMDTRREEVVEYLIAKYGYERVGHVLTTQTIGAREAIRDIARVYEYKERDVSLLLSTIVDDRLSLRENYRRNPQFKRLLDSDKFFLEFVALASKLEGLPRQAGMHAAGIVLNDEPLATALPVNIDANEGIVCELEKDYLEEQGFLKMDILGLRNLTTIERILQEIKRKRGIALSYEELPRDDQKALELIRSGRTMGVFQLESAGMRRAIAQLEPSTFADVVALIALFRPGPMEQIASYAKRKKGQEKIDYPAPELESVLSPTYGIIVYQEQIMQIVRIIAGYSYGEADVFRRAVSKKDAALLLSLKEDFIKRSLENHKAKVLSEEIFALIARFANYGFNKSHAVSYAYLACQMAYLKAHFPEEFFSCYLDTLAPEETKFRNALSEAKTLNLRLLLPDINSSDKGFQTDKNGIRYALNAIKGVPSLLIDAIIEERKKRGRYLDFFDFARRLFHKGLNLILLIRLIDAGVFDELYKGRATLRATSTKALQYAELVGDDLDENSLVSLAIEKPAYQITKDDFLENLNAERKALGLMISGSPLSSFRHEIQMKGARKIGELQNLKGNFITAGLIKSYRVFINKKGQQMAFLDLNDEIDEASFVVFSNVFSESYQVFKVDAAVLIYAHQGRERKEYVVDRIEALERN